MADQILKSASITFTIPKGDDKDTDTGVTVTVSTKFNNQFDLEIASLPLFANNDTWEDTGDKEYTYNLNVSPVKLTQIDQNVHVSITIHPNGKDTVKFRYKLVMIFDDDDPNTAPVKLTQNPKTDITLNQDNRSFTS